MKPISNNQRLSILLVTLLVSILVPFSKQDDSLFGQFFSLLIIAAIIYVVRPLTKNRVVLRRWLQGCGYGLFLLTFLVGQGKVPVWAGYAGLSLVIAFYTSILVLLMVHLFSKGSMNEKLLAAINFYFLTGITFGFLYTLVGLLVPGAFSLPSSSTLDWPVFVYFSFINLTTLGYGDITPIAPIAKSLVVLEATIGVLSPTVMIARFIRPTLSE
ncbi:hypothetical protein EOPP23_15725 [Endozoicomonas sp. OPT23]|uniref:ion channel n=1 Tax=Endozoicomonas sp. OPT23 TaxID=2072845 RepID=UPI00129B489D|nr:ion channel [Endozoicomonas sp. OPT23]MRI34438.1 hypothetical protein [Endozoicomonas sp. OPT23]